MTSSVAIVGGGFSGTLVLANLVQALEKPAVIHWFEERGTLAAGAAYGTTDRGHLLNVPAEKMGAFAGRPEGFFQWLHTPQGAKEARALCPEHAIAAGAYLPRILYARYLHAIMEQALETAACKHIDVRIHAARVTDAVMTDATRHTLSLVAEGMDNILVDALVLATGNLPPRRFAFEQHLPTGTQRYIGNIWQSARDGVLAGQVKQCCAQDAIVIIGTGLTTVDTILTLKKHGYDGRILALSRNGKFPCVHGSYMPYPAWKWAKNPANAPKTSLALLSGLRTEIREAAKQGYDWRSVIDSLRPVTTALWQRLDIKEKQTFMKRLLTLWNVHRHRMAPQIHAELESMRQAGTLTVIAGSIRNVTAADGRLAVMYRERNGGAQTVEAALLINCTGPEYALSTTAHALLRHLAERELITIHPLKAGIAITAQKTALGKADDAIFPIGPLLVGEWLECTAVPELREQAANVAMGVLKRLKKVETL